MRMLIAWVVMLGIAAMSRWVAAPKITAYGEEMVAAIEPGEPNLVALFIAGGSDLFFRLFVPMLIIAALLGATMKSLTRRRH